MCKPILVFSFGPNQGFQPWTLTGTKPNNKDNTHLLPICGEEDPHKHRRSDISTFMFLFSQHFNIFTPDLSSPSASLSCLDSWLGFVLSHLCINTLRSFIKTARDQILNMASQISFKSSLPHFCPIWRRLHNSSHIYACVSLVNTT